MSALTLTLGDAHTSSLDLGGITPTVLAALSPAARRRLRVPHGRRSAALADLFDISGDDPTHVRLLRLRANCHRVGRGMQDGVMEVEGSVGTELGREMRGGLLTVSGSAGDGVAVGMRGGVIRVAGNVGDGLGGPLPGATAGMNGGTVVIGRNAGARCGERLRRGLIVVAGDAGPYLGVRMVAGTIVVFGRCGEEPGHGMRRGSILLASAPSAMPATFLDCGEFELGFVALLAHDVADLSPRLGKLFRQFRRLRRWCGDVACGAKGELLICAH